MVLPFALLVLLVAGGIVAMSMVLVENLMNTTRMKTDDELRLNAAVSGAEFGKQRIINSVLLDGFLPTRNTETTSPVVTSADIAMDDTHFTSLVARGKTGAQFIFNTEDVNVGDPTMKVTIYVYDLGYEPGTGIVFSKGFPPRMRYIFPVDDSEGATFIQAQSYGNSNRGISPLGQDGMEAVLRYYLVSSTAVTSDDISVTVEQSVVVKK